jgi:RNA polymerase sigma-70 factor (ECF subfamily)
MTDSELILLLQKGSLEALGELYDRHQRLVYRTALVITGDNEAAADLLQDVFLRLHRFAAHIDVSRPLEPWLYRVTANQSYTGVIRNQRWCLPIEEVADWIAGNKRGSLPRPEMLNEEWQQVQQAVTALPLSQRVVVVLYYLNDLSLTEISEILEVPVGTVKSRLHYGREALKKTLISSQNERFADLQYEWT